MNRISRRTTTTLAITLVFAMLAVGAGYGCATASRASDTVSSVQGQTAASDASLSQDRTSASDELWRQISQEEAMALMESEDDYVILDVRTEQEFASGHIPDAINIPVETIGTTPPAELPDPNQLIMVYCRSGNRSKQAAEKLAAMGYTNIVEFGGINTWPGKVTTD